MKHRLLLFTCSLFVIFITLISFSPPASAISDETWSWTDKTPNVTVSKYNNEVPYDLCPYSYGTVEMTYYFNYKNVCLFSSDKFKFGVYYDNGRFVTVVSFGDGKLVYELVGLPCYHQGSCIYNEATDSLITMVSHGNSPSTIVIYDHFISRIKPYIEFFVVASVPTLKHHFNATNPKFVFSEATGYVRNLGGFGVSKNGRYIVAEIMHYGFVLIDTTNYRIRRISNFSAQYYMGSNPTIDPAVSNDGKTVVISGANSGFEIITISENCGDWPTEHDIIQRRPLAVKCEILPLAMETYVSRFRHSFHPKFSDDGGEFTIYAVNELASYYLVISANGHESKTMDYIALGDSFTSGEGESDDNLYKVGTNTLSEKCHLSLRSYPYLISRHMDLDPLRMVSVACSGAVTGDVLGYDKYNGQGFRLDKYTTTGAASSKSEALINFTPGNIPQINFVEKYKPKAVTIGIGGNDINLVKKLTDCLKSNSCRWSEKSQRHITAEEIRGLFQTLTNTYSKLIEASPQTKFYAISYPKIFNQTNKCDVIGFAFSSDEREFANQTINYINKIIEAAARRVGIGYIDNENSLGDQVLCGNTEPLAMNALVFGDDINPINKDWVIKVFGSESFHPNPIGHQLMFESITNSVDNLLNYNYCSNSQTVCPNKNILPPEASEYWGVDKSNTKIYKAREFANIKDKTIDILIDDGVLASDEPSVVEIHSDPIKIGTFNTNGDGGLSLSFSIPDSLDYGIHTIHILSKTISGELIDIYQIFEYQEKIIINEQSIEPKIIEIASVVKENTKTLKSINNTLKSDNGLVLGDKTDQKPSPVIKNQPTLITVAKVDSLTNYNSVIAIIVLTLISATSIYLIRKII